MKKKINKKRIIILGLLILFLLIAIIFLLRRAYKADTTSLTTPVRNTVNVIGSDGSSMAKTQTDFNIIDD
jgi:hypothetical protein